MGTLIMVGNYVSIQGLSLGRGTCGVVKKWRMHRGLMTHGSKSRRSPGSIGMRYSGGGGRVMPGLRMASRKGGERKTQYNLRVVNLHKNSRTVVLKGTAAGRVGSVVRIDVKNTN